MSTDSELYRAECFLLVLVAGVLGLIWLHGRLSRDRDLTAVLPIVLAALGLRAVMIAAVTQAGSLGRTIRGTDDPAFLHSAQLLANHPWTSSAWPSSLEGDGLTFVSGAVVKILGDPGDDSLRLLQGVIAAFAVLLLVVAVHDLAGHAAAVATGLVLLIEPSSLFFTTILQKESLLLLAVGLAAFATGSLWKGRPAGAMVAGMAALAVAATVRPYAAGFLAAGLLLCGLHWAVARAGSRRAMIVSALVGIGLAAIALFVVSGASSRLLNRLQEFQSLEAGSTAALRLGPVDFTTPSGIARAIPERLLDFAIRPLPWQLANNEQRLGAVGTLVAWCLALWVLIGALRARRRAVVALPLVLLAGTVAFGYAITSANAGTGFRHRLHVLVLLAGVGAALWSTTAARLRIELLVERFEDRWKHRRVRGRSGASRVAVGGGSLALRYVAVGVLNLGGSVFLIRRLGPEVWATYTVAFFIAAFFDQQVGTKVLGSIIGSTKTPTRRQVGAIAIVSLIAGATILAILLVVRGPIGSQTNLPGLTACLAASGGCALILAVRAPAAALLERDLRFVWIAIAEVLDQVTFFAVAIPVALSGRPISGLALGLLARAIPGAVLLLIVGRPRMARPRRADLRSATAFGGPVIGVAALALIEGLMPFVALGPHDPRGLGWVNTAASLVGYAAVVMLVMQRVSFAGLSDTRRRLGTLTEQTRRVAEGTVLLLLVMLAPTALAEGWVPILFGDSWTGAGAAFAAVGAGYLLMGPITVIAGALYASHAPRRVLLLYLIMTLAYAGLLAGGALPANATGVAAAYACSRVVGLAAAVLIMRPFTGAGALYGTFVAAPLGALGLVLVAWGVDRGPDEAVAAGAVSMAVSLALLVRRQGAWLVGQARRLLAGGGEASPEIGAPLTPTPGPRQ